jgi:hypothetical protein
MNAVRERVVVPTSNPASNTMSIITAAASVNRGPIRVLVIGDSITASLGKAISSFRHNNLRVIVKTFIRSTSEAIIQDPLALPQLLREQSYAACVLAIGNDDVGVMSLPETAQALAQIRNYCQSRGIVHVLTCELPGRDAANAELRNTHQFALVPLNLTHRNRRRWQVCSHHHQRRRSDPRHGDTTHIYFEDFSSNVADDEDDDDDEYAAYDESPTRVRLNESGVRIMAVNICAAINIALSAPQK